MTHHVYEVSVDDKNELVHKLAAGTGRRILFTRTKHRAKRFARQLTAQGIPAVDLHGNLSQGARDRNLAAFTHGDAKVLVWPPTSPPAASTSTRSNSSSTSIPRPNTRPTCTVRAAPLEPAAPVTWSR